MSYIEQFDGLVRLQDYDSRMRNVRTMAVFTDGIVICSVGVSGVWLINEALLPGFGVLGRLLLTVIRPGQQVVHRRRQEAIRKRATSLGLGGTAAAFASTQHRAVAIRFADVTAITLRSTNKGRLLTVQTTPARGLKEPAFPYLTDLPADRIRDVLGPLAGDRLTVSAAN